MFCDVTRCKTTGIQMLSCYSDPGETGRWGLEPDHICEPTNWSGEWPGVKVCRENGWYTDPESIYGYTEDLNSVPSRARWNSELEDWEAKNEA